MTHATRILAALVLFGFSLGCAGSPEPHGDTLDCLDDSDIAEIQAEYLADPEAIESEYVGKELCVDGLVSSIQSQFGSIGVGVNIADQVGTLLLYDEAREPESYKRLAEWAEGKREGDPIRLICALDGIVPVEGAPEPMALASFHPCNLAE